MTGSLEVQLSNALHQRDEARRERDDAEAKLALKQRAADEAVDRALELARQLAEVRAELERAERHVATQHKLPVCADCGHRHRWGGECADHSWNDTCLYGAGADCEVGRIDAVAEDRRQCPETLLMSPDEVIVIRCVRDGGHEGNHWNRAREFEWEPIVAGGEESKDVPSTGSTGEPGRGVPAASWPTQPTQGDKS